MDKRILRVFPSKNSYTPEDELVYIGLPDLLIPNHDEVHISCTFSWDKEYCKYLQYQWLGQTDKPVILGGVAFNSKINEVFTPGLYVKEGVTFTSRGCDNNCSFCIVPKIEGRHKELDIISPGNIIQDNNFLQSSKKHRDKVFDMLKSQKKICFKGGLQPNLIDTHFIKGIDKLAIKELWLACDSKESIKSFEKGCKKLVESGWGRNGRTKNTKIKCYVLIGEDMIENESRLRAVYKAGAMPFAQLYKDPNKEIKYSKDFLKFHRSWCRPAAIEACMKKGTHYKNFNT